MDSSRRTVPGLNDRVDGAREIDGGEALKSRWNAELFNEVMAPLVPSALYQALTEKVVDSVELAALVAALKAHEHLCDRLDAVCASKVLVRRLTPNASGGTWALLSRGDCNLRPVPESALKHPRAMLDLFPSLAPRVESEAIALVNSNDALAPSSPAWMDDELSQLLEGQKADPFQRDVHSTVLLDLLTMLPPGGNYALLPALSDALRRQENLLGDSRIAALLRHADLTGAFAVPNDISRAAMRLLATVEGTATPCRQAWLDGAPSPPRLDVSRVKASLAALRPAIEGAVGQGDQASERLAVEAERLAGRILAQSAIQPSELVLDDSIADAPVVRATDPASGARRVVSLRDLGAASATNRIFRPRPDERRRLRLLARVIPDTQFLEVSSQHGGLDDTNWPRFASLETDAVLRQVRSAKTLGEEEARTGLLRNLNPNDSNDRPGLRVLCTGNPAAAGDDFQLVFLENAIELFSDALICLVQGNTHVIVVPTVVAELLNAPVQRHIGLTRLADPRATELVVERVAWKEGCRDQHEPQFPPRSGPICISTERRA